MAAKSTSVRQILIKLVATHKNVRIVANEVGKLNKQLEGTAKLGNMLRTALSGAVAMLGIGEVTKMMDDMQLMNDRLVALTGSANKAAAGLSEIKRVAKEVKLPMLDLGDTFNRFYLILGGMGFNIKEVGVLVQSLSQFLRLSGANAQEASSFIIQFSQALSMGRLQGQEFRAAMQSNAMYARALAESLGVTQGELKKMSENGQLTIDKMLKPLVGRFDDVQKKADKLNITFGQTMIMVFDALRTKMNELNKQLRLSANFYTAVTTVLDHFKGILTTIGVAALPIVIAGVKSLTVAFVGLMTTVSKWNLALAVFSLVSGYIVDMLDKTNRLSYALEVAGKSFKFLYYGGKIALGGLNELFYRFVNGTLGPMINLLTKVMPKSIATTFKHGLRAIATEPLKQVLATMAKDKEEFAKLGGQLVEYFNKGWQTEAKKQSKKEDPYDLLSGLSKKLKEIGDKAKGAGNPFTKINKELNASKGTLQDYYKYLDKVKGIKLKKLNDQFKQGKINLIEYKNKLKKINKELEKMKTEIRRSFISDDILKGISKGLDDYSDSIKNLTDNIASMVNNSMGHMEDTLVNFVTKGKISFKNMVDAMLADLARLIIRMQITSPIAQALNSYITASANGNVFMNGRVVPFATGGVVSSPTLFPMATGMGLMGEAGPEAIMPLKRGKDGKLGVSGAPVVVNVINNSSGTEATYTERRGNNGERIIDVMVVDKVKKAIANGSLDSVLNSTYGLRRKGY